MGQFLKEVLMFIDECSDEDITKIIKALNDRGAKGTELSLIKDIKWIKSIQGSDAAMEELHRVTQQYNDLYLI